MATKVEIPSMGESVTEATLLRWRKKDGERVEVDEPLCELETDKANVDLPSPAAGILRVLKKEGDVVQIGEQVAQIEAGAGKVAAKPSAPAPTKEASAAKPPTAATKTEKTGTPAKDLDDLSPA